MSEILICANKDKKIAKKEKNRKKLDALEAEKLKASAFLFRVSSWPLMNILDLTARDAKRNSFDLSLNQHLDKSCFCKNIPADCIANNYRTHCALAVQISVAMYFFVQAILF